MKRALAFCIALLAVGRASARDVAYWLHKLGARQ